MCYSQSRESLCTFGIKSLQSGLRREGYSLSLLEETLRPGGSGVVAGYKIDRRGAWGQDLGSFSFEVVIRKHHDGLRLKVVSPGGASLGEFLLVKRESNLKPGTYRYYILDPYSPGKEILCEKLYYLPGVCEFVSPSILRSHRVLYSQQRKGHSSRYYFPVKSLPPTRYRKKHYRGKETPFWEKYQKISQERELRFAEYEIGNGLGRGIIPPDLEEEIIEEYCRRSGRKTRPRGVYFPTRRV